MTTGLDMSLDDLIKSNKKSDRGGGATGRGRAQGSEGPGPARRGPSRAMTRAAPYSMFKPAPAPDMPWKHDMYADQGAPIASPIETGTKLYISNLDYGVSNEDIKELFSEVGDLKRYSIHYDRSGRSKGTAEVVFSMKVDAVAAVKRYNNVQLDGKPMKIEIVGANIVTPAPVPRFRNSTFGNTNGNPKSGPGRGGFGGFARGGAGRGRGRGRGVGRGRSDPVSASDLDADLEKYHVEAMQVN